MRSPRPKIDVRGGHRRPLELRNARQAVRRNLATEQRRVRNREQQTGQPLSPSARLVHRFQPRSASAAQNFTATYLLQHNPE